MISFLFYTPQKYARTTLKDYTNTKEWLETFGYFVEETPEPEMNRDGQPIYRYDLWFHIGERVWKSTQRNIEDKAEAQHQANLSANLYEREYFLVRVDLRDDDESDEFE